METIIVACPHCKALNKLPKKESYKKAVCGVCKGNLLDNKPIKIENEAEFNKIISNVTFGLCGVVLVRCLHLHLKMLHESFL